jgi:hypothetical protein
LPANPTPRGGNIAPTGHAGGAAKGRKIGVVHSGAVKQFSALPLSPRHFKATKRPRRRIPMLPLLMTMGALLFTVIGYALISPDPAPHEGVEEDAGA